MLYDVFGGDGSISLNTNAEHIYYNDIVNYVGDMFSDLKGQDLDNCLSKIHILIT